MKKLNLQEFVENTELNDFKIQSINLNTNDFIFELAIEGAYYFEKNDSTPIIFEDGGAIKIQNYRSFEARYFSPQNKLWNTLDYSRLDMITEINEKTYKDGVLRLAGMGKNGDWIEYLINGGETDITLND